MNFNGSDPTAITPTHTQDEYLCSPLNLDAHERRESQEVLGKRSPEICRRWGRESGVSVVNHAQQANASLTSPVFIRKKWRIGFVAAKDIGEGDEVGT